MKRILALILCCITLIGFSGCVTISTPLEIHSEVKDITSIEVYYLEEPVYVSYTTDSLVYKNRDEDGNYYEIPYTGEPIAYVEEADYEQFISDAEALPFEMTILLIPAAWDPSWDYIGYVVKINCGEDYELVTNSAGGSFRYCEEEAWQNFLKKYIGEEHFNNSQENSQS